MKKSIILIIITLLIFLIFGLINKEDDKSVTNKQNIVAVPEIIPQIKEPLTYVYAEHEQDLKRVNHLFKRPEKLPPSFRDFYELKQSERLDRITTLQLSKKRISNEHKEFLKSELLNRKHWDITRNNIANILTSNNNADPNLYKLFEKMLKDGQEDHQWRDYCVQFLGACIKSAGENKATIINILKEYSSGDDSIAGTALLHMAEHENTFNPNQDKELSTRLENVLEDPKTHVDTKTTILAIMGQRGDLDSLPLVRKYAKQDDNAALKSVAIGSLGLLGNNFDLPCITEAIEHKNGRVRLAAIAAMNRIQKREQNKDD